MALQFGPPALLLPLTGYAADHLDRRKLLFATQAGAGALALGSACSRSRAWSVCGTCTCSRSCSAALRLSMGRRARPSSRSWSAKPSFPRGCAQFHLVQRRASDRSRRRRRADRQRGHGWVFVINAASLRRCCARSACYAKTSCIERARSLGARQPERRLRYVWQRNDLKAVLLMLFLIGTFGINFPIFISSMSVSVFHRAPAPTACSPRRWRSAPWRARCYRTARENRARRCC